MSSKLTYLCIAHRGKAACLLKKSVILRRNRSEEKKYNVNFSMLKSRENAIRESQPWRDDDRWGQQK